MPDRARTVNELTAALQGLLDGPSDTGFVILEAVGSPCHLQAASSPMT